MAQFYFLSIVFNLLAGIALMGDRLGDRFDSIAPLKEFFGKRGVRMGLGILTALVGIFKIFIRAPKDTVPVAGDLLPIIAGIGAGAVLLLEAYGGSSRVEGEEEAAKAKTITTQIYRFPVGILALTASVAHFLFAGAVIL